KCQIHIYKRLQGVLRVVLAFELHCTIEQIGAYILEKHPGILNEQVTLDRLDSQLVVNKLVDICSHVKVNIVRYQHLAGHSNSVFLNLFFFTSQSHQFVGIDKLRRVLQFTLQGSVAQHIGQIVLKTTLQAEIALANLAEEGTEFNITW